MMLLDKLQIVRQFDKSAASYDAVAGMQRDIVNHLIDKMPAKLEAEVKIADLGCGTGYALQQMQQKYQSALLTGVDLSPAMLKIASANTRATLSQADIESLPFEQNSFDVVFSSSAFQWCDIRAALLEVDRVIKPNGRVFASTFLTGTLAQWRETWLEQQVEEQHVFVVQEQIHQVMQELGFTKIKIQQQIIKQAFTSFSDAINSIRKLGAGNAASDRSSGLMGKAKFKLIKEKVETTMMKKGVIELPYQVAYITASTRGN